MIKKEDGSDLFLADSFGRVARKLRISVIDRCNFRCNFCMPEKPEWIPNEKILTFDEITRLISILSKFGVDRVRLSGGEPLARKNIEQLISQIRGIEAINRIGMTTNGYFLEEHANSLRKSGLKSITVSLHSLRPERFSFVTQVNAHAKVLGGIRTAMNSGYESVKLNAVIVRGYNDDEILDFAKMAYEEGLNMRFIEYMPFDGKKSWGMDKVVTGDEILSRIRERYEVVPLERESGSTALNYKFMDGGGEFGIITSISRPFCSDCDRLRLTADGKIVPCLFDKHEYDVSSLLRSGASDSEIGDYFKKTFRMKFRGVESLITSSQNLSHVRPMYVTGG